MKHPPRAALAHDDDGHFLGIKIRCPACQGAPHIFPINWLPAGEVESEAIKAMPHTERYEFNKNFLRPTFAQQVKVQLQLEIEGKPVHYLCHAQIANGRILYFKDCTHAMAGQLTDLLELPSE